MALGDGKNYTKGSDVTAPVPVSGGHAFAAIACGIQHTCAITLDGSVWCWGLADANGLVEASTTNPVELTLQLEESTPQFGPFVALSAGNGLSCALDTRQDVWCWGERGTMDDTWHLH